MAVVFLFHTELLSFCGMSNPRMSPADRRLKPALHIFGRKPEEPAEPEPSQDISTMDERAVSHWLRTLSMDQYISRFEEEGICGLLLANLTEQDLQDIGIDKGLHRKKILMYRDKLQVEGVKALSVRDQWHLNRKYSVARVNGLPDPGVQRFAPAVLDHLKNQEMDVRASEERFIKHVDDLDADLLEQSLYLETLEAINHVVCSQTAFVDQDGGCVREEIQSDSLQVVQGKNALRERIMATRANTEQLAIAVNRFSQANRNKMTDSERDIAKSHLNKSIEMWKEKMLEQAKKASFCNEGLLQRLSERLQSQLPGGFAVRANLQDFSKLTEDKEKAAEKCKRIYNLADRDVQLALEARSGGLKERIDDEEKDLRRLEGRQNRLEEQKGKYEKLKENYRDIGAQQRNETRNIRDWHIKRWWRSMWKEEMEVYEDQVKKDEEQRTSDEQKLDGKLEKIEKELMDIADQKKKRQESIAELKHKDSEKFWNNVLEAEGLLSAEAEVKEKDALLRVVEKQLLEAMKKTGVADPELAAHLITQHERSKILLSEATDRSTEVATNMQSWVSLAEEIVRDPSSATDCLPTALFILRDEHQEQMRRIRKFRPQFLQKIYDSVSAVIALSQPSSTNRTV
ncbi:unnamed protein product [Durusdinium trenchii]